MYDAGRKTNVIFKDGEGLRFMLLDLICGSQSVYHTRFDYPKALLRGMDDRDRHLIHFKIAIDDAESELFATLKATQHDSGTCFQCRLAAWCECWGELCWSRPQKAAGAFAQFPSLDGDSDHRSRQIQLTITYAETLISLSRRLQWKPSLQPRGNSGIRYNRLFGESTTSSILTSGVSTVDPHVCLSCGALFSVSSIFGDKGGFIELSSNCGASVSSCHQPSFQACFGLRIVGFGALQGQVQLT